MPRPRRSTVRSRRHHDVRVPGAPSRPARVGAAAVAATVAFAVASSAVAVDTVVTIDSFDGGEVAIEVVGCGNAGTVDVTPIAKGGDPGPYLELQTNVAAGPDSLVSGLVTFTEATHDPAVDGPIQCISYRESTRMLVGFGDGQTAQLFVRQDGILYFSTDVFQANNLGDWTTNSFDGLRATDFFEVTFGAECEGDVDSHPDFSASGSPIEFGMSRANSTTGGGYSILAAVDTIELTIRTVCLGDLDCDGAIGFGDLVSLLADWNATESPADLNEDGTVDFADLVSLLAAWGPCA